ncbi:MAG: mechanosensitive ion channel family protein [Chloroflexota bacterium]|nr:mechanosensitive ion channel family protein [Chloroflexota bacterium]
MTERLLQVPWWDYENWPTLAVAIGVPLAKAAVLALLTWIAARLARSWFDFATERTGADAHVRIIIGRTVAIGVFILGGITILDTLGVPPTTLVTFVGVVGIGISLALQDILKNFFAGTYLLFERPFRLGDEISIKDQRGVVEHIGVRTTRLRNGQNVLVAIPNAVMFAEIVLNRTNEVKPPETRVAADNERADGPVGQPAAPVAGGHAHQPARVDGGAPETVGPATTEPGGPRTPRLDGTALLGRVGLLGPAAGGAVSSTLASIHAAWLHGRTVAGGVPVACAAWLSRLRARARTAFER